MNRKNLFRLLTGLALIAAEPGQAQLFHSTAILDSVSKSGFYAIVVTPQMSAQVKTDFSDLRIRDDRGNPVPYLIESTIPQLYSDRFLPMTLGGNSVDDSGNNVIIIENAIKDRIGGFRLLFQNAAVSRTIDLAGSNDSTRWYSIVENVGLERRFVQDSDRFSEQLSFPLSSYPFFRIVIHNLKNSPLKLLSVDRPAEGRKIAAPVLLKNPGLPFDRKDSDRVTTLSLRNPLHFHISYVMLRVKSPRFFQRTAVCYADNRQLGDFIISSDSILHFSLPVLNDSLITIRIANDDNPPLQVTAVETGQFPEKLITYLEPARKYSLEMNGENAPVPHYDLIHFKDSIPATIPALAFSGIVTLKSAESVAAKDNLNGWLWPCLTFVIIVLGLTVYKLVRDMGEKKQA